MSRVAEGEVPGNPPDPGGPLRREVKRLGVAVSHPASHTIQEPERFVRICPQHGRTLRIELRVLAKWRGGKTATTDVLVCLTGPHDVPIWVTFDRKRGVVFGHGSEGRATVVVGECDDVLVTPRGEKRQHYFRRAHE